MRNFTVASLAVFTSAAAIKMRSNQIDTTVVVDDNTGTAQPSYESWIGKYNFNGAVDSLLSHMDGCDADRNGVVTLGEIKQCMAGSLANAPQYVLDAIAQYSDDYDIRNDLYLLTLLGPMVYDYDGDHQLSFDELSSYFGDLNYATGTAQELINEDGTVGMDEMLDFVRGQRHGGQTIDGQLEGLSDIISSLMHNPDVNHNLDNVVTLRELVRAVNNGMGLNNDIDAIIQQYGEDYEWQTDYSLVASLLSQGHDLSDYRQAYKIFEALQLPWAIDTFFTTNSTEEYGITIDELVFFVRALFHLDYATDSWAQRPSDWKPLEERHITDKFSEFFKNYWFHLDANYNNDGHVSLTELLEFVNLQAGYPKINIDEIVALLGDDYKWYEDTFVFGSILASRFTHGQDPLSVTHLDYKQAYDYCESIGLPWLVDSMFGTYKDVALVGLDAHDIAEIADNFMYNTEGSFITPPDGWLYMEDRVYYTEPYMVDEESIRMYALDATQQTKDLVNEVFAKLDNGSMTGTTVQLLTEHDLKVLHKFYYTIVQATQYYSPGSLEGVI